MHSPEKRRKKRAGTIFKISAAIFLIAAAFVIWYDYPADTATTGTREFFTDDDGKTWFSDDGTKIAPFDHNGKQAVLAKVFQARNGKQFVGYLMKFSDQAKGEIREGETHRINAGASAVTGSTLDGLLVKRPLLKEWISESDAKAKDVKTITAPDGSRDCVPVNP